jgi:hypothetical protein
MRAKYALYYRPKETIQSSKLLRPFPLVGTASSTSALSASWRDGCRTGADSQSGTFHGPSLVERATEGDRNALDDAGLHLDGAPPDRYKLAGLRP